VKEGTTTIEEVLRVTQMEEHREALADADKSPQHISRPE